MEKIEFKDLAINFGKTVDVIKNLRNKNCIIRKGDIETINKKLLLFFIECDNIYDYVKLSELPECTINLNLNLQTEKEITQEPLQENIQEPEITLPPENAEVNAYADSINNDINNSFQIRWHGCISMDDLKLLLKNCDPQYIYEFKGNIGHNSYLEIRKNGYAARIPRDLNSFIPTRL